MSEVSLPSSKPVDQSLVQRLELAALLLGGALIGLGLVMWVAANWDDLGKFGRFWLVGGVLGLSALVSAAMPRVRVATTLVGVLAIGGLLALVGQTYQSGADPWQLFALWAALALPWTVAARHDASWSLWTIIVFAGLSLWLYAQVGRMNAPPLQLLLPPWLAGGVIVYLLSPWSGLDRWIGRRDWTFRLAAALWLIFVTGTTVPSIIDGRNGFVIGVLGLALAGGLLWLLAMRPSRDAIVMSAATLAVDVILITGLIRSMAFGRGASLSFLMIGLIAAGIVAASAMILLQLLRGEAVQSITFKPADVAEGETPPWPVAVVSGIGALFAAIPLLVFVGIVFGVMLERGPGTYFVGGLLVAGATFMLQKAKAISFTQQLAFIALTTGLILLGFGAFRDMPGSMAALFMAAIVTGLFAVIPVGWIRGLLGMAAATFVTMAIASFISAIVHSGRTGWRFQWLGEVSVFRLAWMTTAAGIAAALFGLPRGASSETRGQALMPFVSGAAVAALLGLMAAAGPTFLMSATWAPAATRLGTGAEAGSFAAFAQAGSLLCALAGAALLWQARPDFGSKAGMAIVLAAVILSVFVPALGPALLLLAAAWVADRKAILVLAVFASLWIIGAFYYWLGWPLQQKAMLLVALGFGIGAVALATGPGLPKTPRAAVPATAMPGLVAAALIFSSAAATGGLTAKGIGEKEAIITGGRRVFVALAPVDPRSLMQGDYMALRFALPDVSKAPSPQSGATLYAIGTIDGRGVVTLTSVSPALPSAADDRIAFVLGVKNGRWLLGTDAWFFREGTAQTWGAARFGEFRVARDGQAILVGMADEQLKGLK